MGRRSPRRRPRALVDLAAARGLEDRAWLAEAQEPRVERGRLGFAWARAARRADGGDLRITADTTGRRALASQRALTAAAPPG
jgi:hypothetical protein